MYVEPKFPVKEYTNKGSIVQPNCFVVLPGKKYDDEKLGGQAGMFTYIKGKAVEYLPILFHGVVVSYVSYKRAWSPDGKLAKKGQPPFCSAILEDTSLRWNDGEKKYEPGPLCFGDAKRGIPACPLYGNACKYGLMVWIVTEDEKLLKLFLQNKDMQNFLEVAKGTKKYSPMSIKSLKVKSKTGTTFYNIEFAASDAPFPALDFAKFEKRADEEVNETVSSQRGENE